MDSESGPPFKRFRSSLASNVQLTECVREFKLPRQYPSMVQKKLQIENDNLKRANLTTNSIALPKTSNASKIFPIREPPINKIRTIKLKGKDGRDLGEVNVQDLPINIQGKTITITKNGIKKSPTALCNNDKKAIPLGNLAPLKIKTEDDDPSENESVMSTAGGKITSTVSSVPPTIKKLPCKGDARPQVLVLRSGHNWHMVKLPHSSTSGTSNPSTKNTVITKSQQSIKSVVPILRNKKDSLSKNITYGINVQVGADGSNSSEKKTYIDNNQRHMIVRKVIRPRLPDSTTDRPKLIKNVTSVENGEPSKPKIEISRIVAPTVNKSGATEQSSKVISESTISVKKTEQLMQHKLKPKQDVMVVLPSNRGAEDTFINDLDVQSNRDVLKNSINSPSLQGGPSGLSAWRRKLLANRRSDTVKYGSSRDLSTPVHPEKKTEMTNNLIILEKALSSVEDEVLREKALKALAECGIGIERLVPVRSPLEQKPVKDSDTQTSIFGLWDNDQFIYVPKDLPTIQRIPIHERTPNERHLVVTNPNFQDVHVGRITNQHESVKESIELNNIVEGFVKGNNSANQVAAIFANPCPVQSKVVEQLQKDFESWNNYDENGNLNIHNAVIADSVQGVVRHLMVLRACEGSADIPTHDGQTSLELAVRYDASPKIIKLLLDAGAEPSSEESGHDTALLIASKKSKASLLELIARTKSCKALDSYDSEGFAALHYCAQNGNEEGVRALILGSADINLPDRRSGRTALFHAIENNHTDLGQILLENGAEANKPNYGGQTIFHIIEETKHYNLLEVLNRVSK